MRDGSPSARNHDAHVSAWARSTSIDHRRYSIRWRFAKGPAPTWSGQGQMSGPGR